MSPGKYASSIAGFRFPHQLNLRLGQAAGLVYEVAEDALRLRDFSGEGAAGGLRLNAKGSTRDLLSFRLVSAQLPQDFATRGLDIDAESF